MRVGGCSLVGRAPALHAGGRRFESVQLHTFHEGSRLYLGPFSVLADQGVTIRPACLDSTNGLLQNTPDAGIKEKHVIVARAARRYQALSGPIARDMGCVPCNRSPFRASLFVLAHLPYCVRRTGTPMLYHRRRERDQQPTRTYRLSLAAGSSPTSGFLLSARSRRRFQASSINLRYILANRWAAHL